MIDSNSPLAPKNKLWAVWKCQLRQKSSKQLCFPIVVVLCGDDTRRWKWIQPELQLLSEWASLSTLKDMCGCHLQAEREERERERKKREREEALFQKQEPLKQRSTVTSDAVDFISFRFCFFPLTHLHVFISFETNRLASGDGGTEWKRWAWTGIRVITLSWVISSVFWAHI